MKAHVALLTPPTKSHRTAEETLALGYLSSILNQNNIPNITIDGWFENLSTEEIIERLSRVESLSVVGISCYRSNLDQSVELLQSIKSQFENVSVICGGYGPTFHDQLFIDSGFDVAVRGEAEKSLPSLVRVLHSKGDLSGISGVTFKKNGATIRTGREEPVINLDLIPQPNRSSINFVTGRGNFLHISTSRGCRANCTFCSVVAFDRGGPRKIRWRERSIVNIVDEIGVLHHEHGVKHFKIVDDSFIEPPRNEEWAKRFRDALKERNLEIMFRTQIRADRLTKPIVSALKEAGWFSTSVGVENGSVQALKRMGKSASVEHNLNALNLLQEFGVYVQMGMILFDPYTTIDELWENLRFLKSHSWPVNKGVFTEMFAAEGTAFTSLGKHRDILSGSSSTQNYAYKLANVDSQRVYDMLKSWHRSHSPVFDAAIDPLTAPKIMSEEGYRQIHMLCRELIELDLKFFEHTLMHVQRTSNSGSDLSMTQEWIETYSEFYLRVERLVNRTYDQQNLHYDGVPNPFLSG